MLLGVYSLDADVAPDSSDGGCSVGRPGAPREALQHPGVDTGVFSEPQERVFARAQGPGRTRTQGGTPKPLA